MDNDNFTSEVFHFGKAPLIVFLAFLNAFVPLSIDLYLPALPHMTSVFQCEQWLTELTLSCFILFFGISMLVWGSLSDKYGRKPVLRTGLAIYMVGSIICYFSPTIYILILGRILQAIGSGAISSVTMAIIKDTFKGSTMENVLVLVQTMTMISPLLAPILGALLLQWTSWRGLFCILAVCSILALGISFCLKETMRNPTQGSAFTALKRIGVVLQVPSLRWLLLLFSMSYMPLMAYINSSSFIYITFFGLTEQQFSLFFAANGAVAMIAPIVYSRLFRHWNKRCYLSLCFFIVALAGFVMHFIGSISPYFFLSCYAFLTFFLASSRPLGTVLVMSQLDTDSGSVAALIGCTNLSFGSIAMLICSLGFASPIINVSTMALVVGAFCFVLWRYLDTNKLYREPSQHN